MSVVRIPSAPMNSLSPKAMEVRSGLPSRRMRWRMAAEATRISSAVSVTDKPGRSGCVGSFAISTRYVSVSCGPGLRREIDIQAPHAAISPLRHRGELRGHFLSSASSNRTFPASAINPAALSNDAVTG